MQSTKIKGKENLLRHVQQRLWETKTDLSLKKFEVVPAIGREIVEVESDSLDEVIKTFLGDIPRDVITSVQTGGIHVLPKIDWKLVRIAFTRMTATKRDAITKSIECEQKGKFLLLIKVNDHYDNGYIYSLTLSDSISRSSY